MVLLLSSCVDCCVPWSIYQQPFSGLAVVIMCWLLCPLGYLPATMWWSCCCHHVLIAVSLGLFTNNHLVVLLLSSCVDCCVHWAIYQQPCGGLAVVIMCWLLCPLVHLPTTMCWLLCPLVHLPTSTWWSCHCNHVLIAASIGPFTNNHLVVLPLSLCVSCPEGDLPIIVLWNQ